jgi:LHFPL tetraspan subfamily member protein
LFSNQFILKYFFFLFPEWVGDLDADVGGRLGLWQICQKDELTDTCTGKLEDLMSMPSVAFQVSFIFKEEIAIKEKFS